MIVDSFDADCKSSYLSPVPQGIFEKDYCKLPALIRFLKGNYFPTGLKTLNFIFTSLGSVSV
jgi:hypothetical protein